MRTLAPSVARVAPGLQVEVGSLEENSLRLRNSRFARGASFPWPRFNRGIAGDASLTLEESVLRSR